MTQSLVTETIEITMPDSIEDSELHRIVQRVVGTLMSERQRPAPEPPAQMEGRRQVALGADHGGFELKGILKTELGTLAVIPQDAESMIKAGATRIGASAGVKIIQGPARPAAAEKPATASSTKNY